MPDAWPPRSEDELNAAASGGLLSESHSLDIKRELSTGTAANRELARDLASFANDGGFYILGVEEQASGPPTLHPIPLPGVPERVEQVALSIPDPPLPVRSYVIEASGRDDEGYLIVRVPTSPLAPHMVDNVYWGRNDRTKYRLSDAEVQRFHQRRQVWQRDADAALNGVVDRDPWRQTEKMHGHLFLWAAPVAPQPGAMLTVIDQDQWQRSVLQLVGDGLDASGIKADWAPNFKYATRPAHRPNGWAVSSYSLADDRSPADDADETDIVEIEISEDAELRAFNGRATDHLERQDCEVAFEVLIAGSCRQFVSLAGFVGKQCGYIGPWDLGVVVTGLRGSAPYLRTQSGWREGDRYSGSEYRQVTRATSEELDDHPSAVTERLVGRLMRSFGVHAAPPIVQLLDATR